MRAWPKTVTGRPRHHPSVDARPEFFTYTDDGCEYSPSCLSCPLPACKYDYPGGALGMSFDIKRENMAAAAAYATREGPAAAAVMFSVSERTIYRAITNQRLLAMEAR